MITEGLKPIRQKQSFALNVAENWRSEMNPKKVNILGMELDEIKFASCTAHFGIGPNFATLYDIESKEEGMGHATGLLKEAKSYYKGQGKKFGGAVALNNRMRSLYNKLNIKEYDKED